MPGTFHQLSDSQELPDDLAAKLALILQSKRTL